MFHTCIPCGKTFSLVPRSRSSVQVKYQTRILLLQKERKGHYGGIGVLQTRLVSFETTESFTFSINFPDTLFAGFIMLRDK